MNDQFIQGVIFDWDKIDKDSYLKGIRAFKGVEKLDFNKPITFFVGENGSGKSTLLEALAVAHGFNPEGGTKNYVFSTHDTHSELCDAIRIAKGYRKEKWGYFLRAESFYNVATQEEEYADITHPSAKYHEKSHGESFLALAQSNMNPNGLYLFDEPEAALSPQRQLTLLMQIYRCAKEGAQFIIVTHSPILLGIPDADIYCFDNGRIHLCEYEDTESYQVTEMFINNRQAHVRDVVSADHDETSVSAPAFCITRNFDRDNLCRSSFNRIINGLNLCSRTCTGTDKTNRVELFRDIHLFS